MEKNEKIFTDSEVFFATHAADSRNEKKVEKYLKERDITNIKVEAIAKGNDAKHGLNVVVYSKITKKGQKEYAVGTFGTNEAIDWLDDGRVALGRSPKQAKALENFLQKFRESKGIKKPFAFGSGYSLSGVDIAVVAAKHPDWFGSLIFQDSPKIGGYVKEFSSNLKVQEKIYKMSKIWNSLPNIVNTHGTDAPEYVIRKFIAPVNNPIKMTGIGMTFEDYISSFWQTHPQKNLIDGFKANGLVDISRKYYEQFANSFTIKVDPNDLSKVSVIFKFDGKKYGEGNSNAIKIGNTYAYRTAGLDEKDVASLFGVPLENVVKGDFDYIDGTTSFTIISPKTHKDIKIESLIGSEYTIKKGDTLWQIAQDNGLSLTEIMNDPKNGYLIERYRSGENGNSFVKLLPGDKIHLPKNSKQDSVFKKIWNEITETSKKMGDAMEQANKVRYKYPFPNGDPVMKEITKSVKKQLNELGKKVNQKIDKTKKFVSSTADDVGEFSKKTVNFLEKGLDKFKGGIKHAMSELKAGFADVVDGAKNLVTSSPNSLLKIHAKDFSSTHNSQDMSTTFRDGLAKYGAGYEIHMPASVLNGDGLTNFGPSSIVTDSWRPGAEERTKVNFKKDMSNLLNQAKKTIDTTKNIFHDVEHSFLQGVNTIKRWSNKYLNIDPIVINLDGNDIKFISLAESEVLFDIDNDGYIENTGWIKKGNAFLVVDKNNNGIVDDITEMISEYYFVERVKNTSSIITRDSAAFLNKNITSNPFQVLTFFDFDGNHIINEKDDIFSKLRLWHDKNEDGFCSPSEMHLLSEYNIISINLRYKTKNESNIPQIKSMSHALTIDGRHLSVYAIAFDYKAEGDMFQSIKIGKVTRSETGFASLKLASALHEPIFLSKYKVQNLYGSDEDDEIYGNKQDNWIFGGLGCDKIFAGSGNDVIVIDEEDDPNFIDGGKGYDIVYAVGGKGIEFIMYPARVEQVYGTDFADFIAVGNHNNLTASGFIDGKGGDDLLIGDNASDAISGGDGNDYIKGMGGNDLLRGDRGDDIIEGGEGNDIIEGGLGDDILVGGLGNDTLRGSQGHDKLYGGKGTDYAEFIGDIEEYKIAKINDRHYIVQDLHPNRDGYDELFDVEKVVFTATSATYTITLSNFIHSYEDFIPLNRIGVTIINVEDLLKNDLNFSPKEIYICGVKDAQGGELTLEQTDDKITRITFIPNDKSFKIKQFGYTICTPDFQNTIELIKTKESAIHYTRVCLTESKHPSDDLFYKQWYLNYINVVQLWKYYSGKGIRILVNEGDADYTHKDLKANMKIYDASKKEEFNVHATKVAGVVAASRNNVGLVGMVYSSILGSEAAVLSIHKKYDVINRSWKWSDSKPFLFGNYTVTNDEYFVKKGRKGFGTNIIQSAGNERESGDNTNDYEQTNSPFVIVVGALYKDASLSYGETNVTAFSNKGASILVSAPGSHILTSSAFTENDNGNIFTWDYDVAKGTSFSAPIVTGVVALMLEANPELGYRDIQKILASTARIIGDESLGWEYNSDYTWNFKGRHYSHDYGFGCVDAYLAVKTAEFWPYLSVYTNKQEKKIITKSGYKLIESGNSTSGEVFMDKKFIVQDVILEYEISHKNFSNITIELISPFGTKSILKEDGGKNATHSTVHFRALSKHFLGEESLGSWQYLIRNNHAMQLGFLKSLNLTILGDLIQPKLYMVTPEFKFAEHTSIVFNETDKEAIFFMPSLEESLSIDLASGRNFKILGVDFIASNNVPNKIVAGTGDDIIIGNANSNIFYGNDGRDIISGLGGNDLLVGNRGSDSLTGGDGSDIFVIHYEAGVSDIVTDFSDEDFVVFVKFKSHMRGTTMSHNSKGTEFSFLNSQIVEFTNYNLTLSSDNVIFVENFNYYSLFIANVTGGYHKVKTNINQILLGREGKDVLHGGDGNDLIIGGNGNNILMGWDGRDIIRGGTDDDVIFGHNGNDIISGGLGKNHLTGGRGHDVFVFQHIRNSKANFTDVIYDFNMAEDKLDFSNAEFDFIMLRRDYMKEDNCPSEYVGQNIIPCSFIANGSWQIILVGVEINKVAAHAFIF